MTGTATETRQFSIKVLGRTLEHLGAQMYKRRDTAIAELVANCWDAGASEVRINLPDPGAYDRLTSTIVITDNGDGMTSDQVQDEYLIIGRNRRASPETPNSGRLILGRKGIGKLAGFGISSKMTVLTWCNDDSTEFTLDVAELKKNPNQVADVPIIGNLGVPVPDGMTHGTEIRLQILKHKTPIAEETLHRSLARRYSRTIRGEMAIFINNTPLKEPALEIEFRFPVEGFREDKLADGNKVRYYYAFSKDVISTSELRGFTIYARGKTAQAPPYFFGVEGQASGQHGTRYVTGEIDASFLDAGTDDESDIISTDRQEIDWDSEQVAALREWGAELSRKVLRDWVEWRGKRTENWVLEDADLSERIDALEGPSRNQVLRFVRTLGQVEADTSRSRQLIDTLIRAYEFRQFHNLIDEIERAEDDTDTLLVLLAHMHDWRVLESRAILEIIEGRIHIVTKFYSMVVNDAPETAHTVGQDNIHDMIGRFPWLLEPEWQVFREETTITKQLQEWGDEDIRDAEDRSRYDFMALGDTGQLLVIEIKRSGHPVVLDDLHQLERYKSKLSKGETRQLYMLLLCGDDPNVDEGTRNTWAQRPDGRIGMWKEVLTKTRRQYEHYRAVLQGDVRHPDFSAKATEVQATRHVIDAGSAYRTPEERKKGISPQEP